MRRLTRCLLPALPLAACAPVIAHGPRVAPGFTATGTAAIPFEVGYGVHTQGDPLPYLFTPFGASFAYGFRARSRAAPALRLGVHMAPSILTLVQGDAYLQAPEALGPFAAGIGVNGDANQVTRYAQLGYTPGGRVGAYATHALTVFHGRGESIEPSPPGPRVWVSTFALQLPGSQVTKHAFVTVARSAGANPRGALRPVNLGIALERGEK